MALNQNQRPIFYYFVIAMIDKLFLYNSWLNKLVPEQMTKTDSEHINITELVQQCNIITNNDTSLTTDLVK